MSTVMKQSGHLLKGQEARHWACYAAKAAALFLLLAAFAVFGSHISVAEGMTNWGTSQAAETSPYLYAALMIFLNSLSLAAAGVRLRFVGRIQL